MTVSYRPTLANYYADKGGSYVTLGSIVPTLVGVNSDKNNNVATQDPEYDYRGYLYCDGAQYDITAFPGLYEVIGNEYSLPGDLTTNALYTVTSGSPGTPFRTFNDGGNVYVEIYGTPKVDSSGTTYYDRVIPNDAVFSFPALGDYPAGVFVEGTGYRLNYALNYQPLAQRSDTHIYRVLINYDPNAGTGGTPSGTITWDLTSSILINDGGEYNALPLAHYGTVPAIAPGTYDPLTGSGYPTDYEQYESQGARNDTPSFNWSAMVGLPDGVTVDNYEIALEDLSVEGTGQYDASTGTSTGNEFILWRVQNIPNTFTAYTVNQSFPVGVTILTNQVTSSSIGTSTDWVNNGYCGPQPPAGERHIYRFHVKAVLTNTQEVVQYIDFEAGQGPIIQQPAVRTALFQPNLNVTGAGSSITNPVVNVDFTTFTAQTVTNGVTAGHPTVRIRKPYRLADYPYILGKFRVPDYRDRKLIGFGEGVDGAGTPLVEDRISMRLGDVGGRWYISKDVMDDPGEFFEISDVLTTGYSDVTTQIEPYLIGEKKYTVGPIQDYIFNKPPIHDHQLLHSQPEEATEAPVGGVDTYTSSFNNFKGALLQFNPGGAAGDGIAKGHSHGLLGSQLSNRRISTYGNTDGIGESTDAGGGCLNYRITEAPAVEIASASGNGTTTSVTTSSDHGLSPGDAVVLFNTGVGTLEAAWTVESTGLTANQFQILTSWSGSISGGSVREAAGYFEEQTAVPTPRMYTVDNQTVIGGKTIPGVNVGLGELRYENEYTSGTHTIAALARTSSYEFTVYGGGGGGGGSTGNGGQGGTTSISLFVDGVQKTIYIYGGSGGGSGNSGGSGGQGGTVSIPTELVNDDRFTFNINTSQPGGSGGSGNNGGYGGQDVHGDGGDGGFNVTTIAGTSSPVTYYGSGGFSSSGYAPAGASVTSVQISLSGAGGGTGGGTPGQGGCSTPGGSPSSGRLITGTYTGGGYFSHSIGSKGGNGVNNAAGKHGEPQNNSGGGGPGAGGAGGGGAWGHGSSGGKGGGSSGVQIGGGWMLGAGGGGGGGGAGGGFNGGHITDTCWTGGPGIGPVGGTYASSSIGPGGGHSGSASGCTAGGGGGGGGGFGSIGGGSGGSGGSAGAGHVNTGSGSGGSQGQSAYRSSSMSGVSVGNGSYGNGYVTYRVNYLGYVNNPGGGGGGSGASVFFGFAVNDWVNGDVSSQIVVQVGGGGSGGSGNGNAGSSGYAKVSAYEIVATDVGDDQLTDPAGRFWEVDGLPTDTPTFPAQFLNAPVWQSASVGVNVVASTGSNFPLDTQRAPESDRFVEFSGEGDRFLEIGPLNLLNVEQMIFTVIKGNGSNGGDAPEESLMCYFKTSQDSPSETLLEAIAQASTNNSGYVNYIIDIDEENDIRDTSIYLMIRQTRPASAGDNDEVPDGKTNDKWGLAQFGLVYGLVTTNVFVPSSDATLPGNNPSGSCGPDGGINVIRRTVSAANSNIRFSDGELTLTGSTPVSVTAEARVTENIALLTRYHRTKYLIKAY